MRPSIAIDAASFYISVIAGAFVTSVVEAIPIDPKDDNSLTTRSAAAAEMPGENTCPTRCPKTADPWDHVQCCTKVPCGCRPDECS